MRLDQVLPTLGIIKRRTLVKELADNGMILVNGTKAKPSRKVSVGDTIEALGSAPIKVKLLEIPAGSVSKDSRSEYYISLS